MNELAISIGYTWSRMQDSIQEPITGTSPICSIAEAISELIEFIYLIHPRQYF